MNDVKPLRKLFYNRDMAYMSELWVYDAEGRNAEFV